MRDLRQPSSTTSDRLRPRRGFRPVCASSAASRGESRGFARTAGASGRMGLGAGALGRAGSGTAAGRTGAGALGRTGSATAAGRTGTGTDTGRTGSETVSHSGSAAHTGAGSVTSGAGFPAAVSGTLVSSFFSSETAVSSAGASTVSEIGSAFGAVSLSGMMISVSSPSASGMT